MPGQKLCKKCFTEAQNLLNLVEGFDDPQSSATNSASNSQDLFDDLDDNQSKDESTDSDQLQVKESIT